jgi:hypothetical protein
VLGANVIQSGDIKFRSSDPTEPLSKSVIEIHHIPMTSSVGNRNRTFGPVVIPLRNLNKDERRRQYAQ